MSRLSVEIEVWFDNKERTMLLTPDTPVVIGMYEGFNWTGKVSSGTDFIEVVIPHSNSQDDLREEDFELDSRVTTSKVEIIDRVRRALDKHLA